MGLGDVYKRQIRISFIHLKYMDLEHIDRSISKNQMCLFVFMLFCEGMKTILYGMGWELCLDPAQMEISLIRPPQL